MKCAFLPAQRFAFGRGILHNLMKENWFVFYYGERELCACTVRGSFPGEIEATVELLASENNIPKETIRVAVEKRKSSVPKPKTERL